MNKIKIYDKEDLKRFERSWYRSNSFWFVVSDGKYVDYFKNAEIKVNCFILDFIEDRIVKNSEEKLILQLTKNLKESDKQKLKESMKILEDYYYTDNV